MDASAIKPIVLLVGPTAVGKSSLSSSLLTSSLPMSIVNIDSMQCYCNLPIASANPAPPHPPHSLYAFRDFIQDDLLGSPVSASDSELLTSSEPNLPATFFNYTVQHFCTSLSESLSSIPPDSTPILCGGSMNYAANVIDHVLCSSPTPVPSPAASEKVREFDERGEGRLGGDHLAHNY